MSFAFFSFFIILILFPCSQDTVHMLSCIFYGMVTTSKVRKRKKNKKQKSGRVRLGDMWQQKVINCLKSIYWTGAAARTHQRIQTTGKQQRTGTGVHNNDEIYSIAPHNVQYHRLMMMMKEYFCNYHNNIKTYYRLACFSLSLCKSVSLKAHLSSIVVHFQNVRPKRYLHH